MTELSSNLIQVKSKENFVLLQNVPIALWLLKIFGDSKTFEGNFLFLAGRYLSNILGVVGFIAVLTSLILFGSSIKTKPRNLRRLLQVKMN